MQNPIKAPYWAMMAIFLAGCASSQIKRAREFVEAEEFESARQELRVELKNHADNSEAKSLMLFMDLADDSTGQQALQQCLFLDASAQRPSSTAAEEAIKARKMAVRKTVLDRGIPTEDWAEYEGILRDAIAYGWSTHKYSEGKIPAKLTFALCSALDGDSAAMNYIVDHLANKDPDGRAQAYLYILGEKAAGALKKVSSQPENLAAAGAEEVLRSILLAKRVIQFSKDHKDHVSLSSVRTGRGDANPAAAGRFLLSNGWKDDNKDLKDIIELSSAISAFSGTDQAPKTLDDYQVAIRQARVGQSLLAFLTIAVPSSQSTAAAEGELLPAGLQASFLTEAWQWNKSDWSQVTIDSKPSVAGPDRVLMSVQTSTKESALGPDQVLLTFYRGIETTTVNTGWFGGYATDKARTDKLVYHLGQANLEFVKDLNPPAAQQ